MDLFPQFGWTKNHIDIEEAIPVDMPEPLGRDVDVHMMCDSDHTGGKGPDTLALVFLSSVTWL